MFKTINNSILIFCFFISIKLEASFSLWMKYPKLYSIHAKGGVFPSEANGGLISRNNYNSLKKRTDLEQQEQIEQVEWQLAQIEKVIQSQITEGTFKNAVEIKKDTPFYYYLKRHKKSFFEYNTFRKALMYLPENDLINFAAHYTYYLEIILREYITQNLSQEIPLSLGTSNLNMELMKIRLIPYTQLLRVPTKHEVLKLYAKAKEDPLESNLFRLNAVKKNLKLSPSVLKYIAKLKAKYCEINLN